MNDSIDQVDIRVENQGSMYLLIPETDAARVDRGAHRAGRRAPAVLPTLVIEPRFVRDIIDGAIAYGLVVR
jgi:hypothetical protein